ncbi:MAG TPA: nitrogen fixation protein NifH, partial [Thermoleophilia bacterium]|nr:nitrogen fixation protein NifH [Thermoleophilia bacterium]
MGGVSFLNPEPETVSWLLEGGAPVRHVALTRLLGAPPNAPEVKEVRRAIMTEGPVPRILAEQHADGQWVERDRFYRAKYQGTVWTLLILAELGADGADARVRAACEAILRDAQDPDSGGFSYDRSKKAGGGLPSGVIPCLTGNLVFSLIRLGMLDDPRVGRAVDWITTYQRFDDAVDEAPTGWPYDKAEMCWGRHTCSMGAAKALKALAEVPPERRTPAVHGTISAGAEFLLRHHVHRRSHDLTRDSRPGWRRFGFPLMYQTDALEILLILTRLGREGEVALG